MNSKQSNKSKNISIPLNSGIERMNDSSFRLEDAVNIKPEKGKLVPIQFGKYFSSAHGYTRMYIHRGGTYVNYIGIEEVATYTIPGTGSYGDPDYVMPELVFAHDKLNVINIVTGATIQELDLDGSEFLLQIQEIGNYLIIATSKQLRRYLYDDGAYNEVSVSKNINFKVIEKELEYIESESVTVTDSEESGWREAIASKVFKLLNAQSDLGRVQGALSIRAAYRLIDGSYIMTTVPVICYRTAESWSVNSVDADPGSINSIIFATAKYTIEMNPDDYASLESSAKIIDSIVFFASKPIIKYDFEAMIFDDTGDDESGSMANTSIISDNSPLGNNSFESFSEETIRTSEDYKYLLNPTNWYKVLEIDFNELINLEESKEYDFDLDRYYQDYATRENLEIDQNTHHIIQASNTFTYNSRLWISGIQRKLSAPTFNFFGANSTNKTITLSTEVKINTGNGSKYVVESKTTDIYLKPDNSFFIFSSSPSYFDARATQVRVFATIDAQSYLVFSSELKSSKSHNYSYIDDELHITSGRDLSFIQIECKADASTLLDDINNNDIEVMSNNTVMLSELYNPLLFPALHTYNVGEGTINYFGVSSFPVSEGQFGQYPVFIFTSSGIYAANIGTGEVIVTSVIPISTDIATSRPVTGHNTLFYATKEGIYTIQGNQPSKLSQPLEGYISTIPDGDIGSRFAMYSNNSQVSTLGAILTDLIDFKDVVEDTILVYDNTNKRLIVSIPTHGYSYIFDIQEKAWYRLSDAYDYIVHDFPIIYSIADNSLTDITHINKDYEIKCHFHTSPFNISTNHRKKLKESLLQCRLRQADGFFAAVALFASNDGVHFTRITGNDRKTGNINDIQLTYMAASYKYFVLAFWGILDNSFHNSIQAFNMQVEERYSHRLRSY